MDNREIKLNTKWLLLAPAIFCYFEIVFKLLQKSQGEGVNITSILLSIIVGTIVDIFLVVFNKKSKIILNIIIVIVTIIYMLESYLYRMFSTYYSMTSVRDMSGNVVSNYTSEIVDLVFGNMEIFMLYLVPILLLIIFNKKISTYIQGKKVLFILALTLVVLIVLNIVVLNKKFSRIIEEHTFNSTTTRYGLNNGFLFDSLSKVKRTSFNVKENIATSSEIDKNQYNYIPIDFDNINLENKDNFALRDINNYVKSLKPSKKNEYTGLFKGKNLVLICAEAFYGYAADEELTPTLYRLMNNGFDFKDYYNPLFAVCTTAGEYQFLTGFVPIHGVESMKKTISNNNYFTMASQMSRIGYNTSCYHDGYFDYYNRDITHEGLGYDYYLALGNGLEKYVRGRNDYELFDKTLDLYKNKTPFSVFYMTYDGHLPYTYYGDEYEKYKGKVEAKYGKDVDFGKANYLTKLISLDVALENYLNKLEENGLLNDTVICLTADHYPYGLGETGTNSLSDLYGFDVAHSLLKDRDRNRMILWTPKLEDDNFKLNKIIDTPTASIDIVPTLSNLFGLNFDSRFMPGRDVFADEEPLVMWDNYSFMTSNFFYNNNDEKVYPKEGYEVSDEELNKYKEIVKYKIKYSREVVNIDYFEYLFRSTKDANLSEEDEGNHTKKEIKATYEDIIDLSNKMFKVKTVRDIDSLQYKQLDLYETVKFGRYEQDNDLENGEEDIEWIIIDKVDKGVLLLSKYILDAVPYCEKSENNTWEKSNVRAFLNTEFYDKAFIEDEKKIIFRNNDDNVFLFDINDFVGGFDIDYKATENKAIATKGTDYAKARGLFIKKSENNWYNENSMYWVKNTLSRLNCNTSIVEYNGYISTNGAESFSNRYGVRPAVWLYWE